MPACGAFCYRAFTVRGVPDLEQAVADAFAAFQPVDIPDAKTYRGHAGLLEAFRDWPSQWDEFSVDLDVDVWNVHVFDGGGFTSWNMFLTHEEALAAARDVRLRTG